MSKYRNAKQLIERMTETVDTIDCEEILRKLKDWALNDYEFNAKEEFEKYLNPVLNPNQNKDSFVYSIITFLYNQLIEATDLESNDLFESLEEKIREKKRFLEKKRREKKRFLEEKKRSLERIRSLEKIIKSSEEMEKCINEATDSELNHSENSSQSDSSLLSSDSSCDSSVESGQQNHRKKLKTN
jgi:hypothetical protein